MIDLTYSSSRSQLILAIITSVTQDLAKTEEVMHFSMMFETGLIRFIILLKFQGLHSLIHHFRFIPIVMLFMRRSMV